MTHGSGASNLGHEPAGAYAGIPAVALPTRGRAGSAAFARGLSLLALLATLAGLSALARTVYELCTDAFVAPLILSADSELVLPSKLSLARLEAERAALIVRIEQGKGLLRAAEVSSEKLTLLASAHGQALDWVRDATAETVRVGERDLSALHAQRALLRERVAEQKAHIQELTDQLAVGLVRKSDLAHELDTLQQLRVAALQFERDQLGSQNELWNAQRAQDALAVSRGREANMPEILQHREQLMRIEVELLKNDSERSGKLSELRIATAELAKLDALIEEIKQRPIFRAIASRQNVAFVPYTQLDGIAEGAVVHDCALWRLFFCRPVGRVSSVLPGEVAAQDPWGAVARGQYALLDLTQPAAARARVLRVRRVSEARAAPPPPERASAR